MPRTTPVCRDLADVAPVPCPCGESRRVITAADDVVMGFHVTTIRDAEAHFHRRTEEIYYVLEGTGELVVHGSSFDLSPGTVVYVRPGCVHRGDGGFVAAIVCLPPFDPDDEVLVAGSDELACPCLGPVCRRLEEVEPIRSACGSSTRLITRDDQVLVGLHVVRICEAETHYHERTTEIYHILEGAGVLRVGEEAFELSPGVTVYVPAGVPHGGEGDFTSIVVCAPPFDPADHIVV